MYPSDPAPEHWLLMAQQRYAKYMNLVRTEFNGGSCAGPGYRPILAHPSTLGDDLPSMVYKAHSPAGAPSITTTLEAPTSTQTVSTSQSLPGNPHIRRTIFIQLRLRTRGVPVNWPPREPTTADKTPPPGLTPAQHDLWMADVHAQREMEKHSFLLHQLREQLQSTERRIEKLRNSATPVAAPAKSSGGFLSRLARGPTVTPLDKLLKTKAELESGIDGQAKWYVERQLDFGRKRWPLLVAARGWGDPDVTEGKYVRPPQGTMELGFPVYSGTWYGRTPLGYFD